MIPAITELNFPIRQGEGKSYATISQATCSLQHMGEKTITTQVKIDGDIEPDFSYDWAIIFRGEKYIMPLRSPQAAKDNTSLYSKIDLTFQHWAIYQLKRWFFFTPQPIASGTPVADKYIASVSLTLPDFKELFAQVLAYYFGDNITIDLNTERDYSDEAVAIDISYSYLWDVLLKLYDTYAVRWEIVPVTGTYDRYVIRIGYPVAEINHIFKYGFEGGLLKVERQVQSADIRNMYLGRGGNQNLPYRYFKDVDADNPSFPADPDWIPELRNIYFSELRGKTFRDYVKGWKTNPRRQLLDEDGKPITPYPHKDTQPIKVEAFDEEYAAKSFAYLKGHTDETFNPVEYVADELEVVNSEVLPAKGSSIEKYGELLGGLDNNEDIYPSIQGATSDTLGRLDVVVDVEKIESDDVAKASESEVRRSSVPELRGSEYLKSGTRSSVKMACGPIVVPEGFNGNLDLGRRNVSAGISLKKRPMSLSNSENNQKVYEFPDTKGQIEIEKELVKAFDADGKEVSSVGLKPGTYSIEVQVDVHNTTEKNLHVTIEYPEPELIASTPEYLWAGTWNIWIKNIWGTTKKAGESDVQYRNRVWDSILGDRAGAEARVVFSDGMLGTSEDYEFVIVENGVNFDNTRTITEKDGVEYASEWRLTLAKSDADLESTGLYLPSTRRFAKSGDHFFFVGIDMPHSYVLWAEQRLDEYKRDMLREVSDIKPTWIVSLDKVRLMEQFLEASDEHKRIALERGGALLSENNEIFVLENSGRVSLYDVLREGSVFTLFDPRFIPGAHQEKLYLQSLTYTFREPTSQSAALIPDVEVVLSDKYEVVANPVTKLSGEVSAISRQLGSISNIEQIVRVVGDKLYLRKDGMADRSMSPTEFFSLLSSTGFRSGIVGGAGWGFFKDESGAWVLEIDRLNVRQDMQVNNLVVNQISARGGMIVESAAAIEVTSVVDTGSEYVCFFDQKNGSVPNLFEIDDVGLCYRFKQESEELKYYRRRVISVGDGSITLSKRTCHGDGIPEVGDVIVQYGNLTKAARQYVKVRDVVGGGYERYIEGLDRVDAEGAEYFFVGRQAGVYNGRPRFYIGDKDGYIEYKNGKLTIKGSLDVTSTIGDKPIGDYIEGIVGDVAPTYMLDLDNEVISVLCTPGGVPISSVPVSSQATLYKGSTPVDPAEINFSLPGLDESKVAASIDSHGRVTVRELKAETASVTVQAYYKGVTVQTALSLFKVIPGAQGADAVVYSIIPSVNVITKAADGSLSASSVECVKYATSQKSTVLSIENFLFYRIVYEAGFASDWTLVAGEGVSSAAIAVPTGATSIIFELRASASDDKSVLDRETVPVLSDLAGLVVGGTNLLRNSDFLDGKEFWRNRELPAANGDVTYLPSGDDAVGAYLGRGTLRFNIHGLDEAEYYSAYQTLDAIRPGTSYTFSFYAYVPAATGLDSYAHVSLRFYHKDGGWQDLALVMLNDLATDRWVRCQAYATIPQAEGALDFMVQVQKNGIVYINSPKVEEGNIATAWSASPLDTSYLRNALQQGGVTKTGLMLATLLQMGYTDSAGNWVVRAGMNGSVKLGARDLVLFAGGDAIDAAEQPTATDRARSAIRADGSAYFGDNTVRIEGQQMHIANGNGILLTLDGNGLTLFDDSTPRLRVVNSGVGDLLGAASSGNVSLNSVEAPALKVVLGYKPSETKPGGITSIAQYYISSGDSVEFNLLTQQFTAGSSMNFLITVPTGLSQPSTSSEAINFSGTASLEIIAASSGEVVWRSGIGASNFQFRFIGSIDSLPVTDRYKARITIDSSLVLGGSDIGSRTLTPNISGNVRTTPESRTILGNDGLLSVWGEAGLLINKSGASMRFGETFLRVDRFGVRISTDGSNWKEVATKS
ncbi:MAG: hypothetical protein NC418_11555 [Muribaculaceae bacterium]|nr:hypothetical protein [Muribaculaceae bacterium]